MIIRHFPVLLALATLGLALPASAQVVYDNGPAAHTGGSDMTAFIEADDFTFATSTTFDTITFPDLDTGQYFGSVVYQIYDDNGGQVGDLSFQGETTAVDRVATGADTGAGANLGPEYINTVHIAPITLAPGTYWLGLHDGPLSLTDYRGFFWESSADNSTATSESLETGNDQFLPSMYQLSFQLSQSAPVPEASSLASLALLLALGARGLIAARRKTSQS